MGFNFSPEDGLLNTQEFPDKPASGTVARNQFMRLFNQIKDYINGMESNGVKAKGGNADTVGGKAPGQFADTHNHDNRYLSSNGGTVNGDIVMGHSKNIIFANDFGIKGKLSNGNSDYLSYMSADDRVVVGYNNREIIINCDNPIQRNGYKMWHEGNFNPNSKANSTHYHNQYVDRNSPRFTWVGTLPINQKLVLTHNLGSQSLLVTWTSSTGNVNPTVGLNDLNTINLYNYGNQYYVGSNEATLRLHVW